MLTFRKVANFCLPKRKYSSNGTFRIILEHLKERSLIRVAGEDVTDFLQGLITNDIQHLSHRLGGSMYTMFLNTKGRVLYDTIIYGTEERNSYFVECDKAAVETIQKHLKIYRVRRKVEVTSLDKDYSVYSLFKFNESNLNSGNNSKLMELEGAILPLPETSSSTKIYKDLMIFKDPRVSELGSRVISKVNTNVKDQICEIIKNVESPSEDMNYKILRYSLGVGEGFNDLPVANCFPLECNCDYLHGVSFHKGCYIGQELTARTHHTGVVRKRLMPLFFTQIPTKLPTDNIILHKSVNLGRLRGVENNVGLALLRIGKALDFGEFSVGNGIARVIKPGWWPVEAPKEKINMETEVKHPDTDSKTDVKIESSDSSSKQKKEEKEVNYFQCSSCIFKQPYEYFGRNPPQIKNYILLEDAYVIEDPFFPPKQGRIVVLGAHCIKCRKCICKDVNCSVYFDGSFCIECAKTNIKFFPLAMQEKINRII